MSEPRPPSPTLWTAIYVGAAGLYIVLSDWAATTLLGEIDGVQTVKGLAFVAVTAAVLHAILRRYRRAVEEVVLERAAAERRAAIRDLIPYPFVELDGDGSPQHFNDAAFAVARKVRKVSPAEILPPEHRSIAIGTLRTGRPEDGFRTTFDDNVYSWHFSPSPETGVVYAYGADISDALLLERQLRLAQRMESVGLLAGGIAHDFNNLLTVIKGNAQLAREAAENEDTKSLIREVETASDRAAALVRHLLAYSRRQVLQPREMALDSLVGGMRPILERTIPESIAIRIDLDAPVRPIFADPTQIEQVLLNLVVNAKDAMPEGGRLTIAVEDTILDEPLHRHDFTLPAGRYSTLAVSDTGIGMDEETRKRIYDPFFTTKPPSTGTGLGLATAYGIVKQSRGFIEAESEPGKGTRFRIHFPVS